MPGSDRRNGQRTPSARRAAARRAMAGSVSACSSWADWVFASLIEAWEALKVVIALSRRPLRSARICSIAVEACLRPGDHSRSGRTAPRSAPPPPRPPPQITDDGRLVQLLDLAAEGRLERLGSLHDVVELDALLRPERGLPEDRVVGEGVARGIPGRRIERLALARDLDRARAQEAEREQPDGFELPAVGLLLEPVRERLAVDDLGVLGRFSIRAMTSLSGPWSSSNTTLPPSSRRRCSDVKTPGNPWRSLAVSSASVPFFRSLVLAAACPNRVKTSGRAASRMPRRPC